MQKEIHPKYYQNAVAVCACGRSHIVGSTVEKISVEICSGCHPFYSGSEKIIDTAGRVEKFKARVKAKTDKATKTSASKKTKESGAAKPQTN